MRTQAASLTVSLMGTGRSDGTTPRGRRTEDSEFLKNTINIDKFTGFFDKKLCRKKIVRYCNIKIFDKYTSVDDSNKATKNFSEPHLPAFAMI